MFVNNFGDGKNLLGLRVLSLKKKRFQYELKQKQYCNVCYYILYIDEIFLRKPKCKKKQREALLSTQRNICFGVLGKANRELATSFVTTSR